MEVIVQGYVRKVIYKSNDDTFCIFLLKDYNDDSHTIKGNFASPKEGDEIEVQGSYTTHAKYGRQILATYFEKIMPYTTEGAVEFLFSLEVRGLGEKSMQNIVRYFGEDLVHVIKNEPDRILEVPKVRKSVKEEIYDALKGAGQLEAIGGFLNEHGLSMNWAKKIYDYYGPRAVEMIQYNPYQLIGLLEGFHFAMADRIGRELGIGLDDERRIEAAFKTVLEGISDSGHTCLPMEELLAEVDSLLGGYSEEAWATLKSMISSECVHYCEYEGMQYIYPLSLYMAESNCAYRTGSFLEDICEPIQLDVESFFQLFEERNGLTLAEEQKSALRMAFTNKMSLITGGPGTGKTTIIKALVEAFQKAILARIVLCAPTGRAAKRLSEATGFEATTIHRLLMPIGNNSYEFMKNEDDLLEADIVIVDEASMLNMQLFDSLLRAIPQEAYLVLVGDTDQLPPIGAGFVLRDLIESQLVPFKVLDHIYRQQSGNLIVSNAHAINEGRMPALDEKKEFIFHAVSNGKEFFEALFEAYDEALEQNGDPLDVQVISPMRKRDYGSYQISKVMQEREQAKKNLSDDYVTINGQHISIGDKVIQNTNDYNLDVYNGEIGLVYGLSKRAIMVKFIDKEVTIPIEDAQGLSLAYAITVHKSQGSEYGTVIIPFIRQYYNMLQRNLLYTAVTRAREKVIIIGSVSALEIAVNTVEGRMRYSLLIERIKGLLDD